MNADQIDVAQALTPAEGGTPVAFAIHRIAGRSRSADKSVGDSSLKPDTSYFIAWSTNMYPAVMQAIRSTPISVGGAGTGTLKYRHAPPIASASKMPIAVFMDTVYDTAPAGLP